MSRTQKRAAVAARRVEAAARDGSEGPKPWRDEYQSILLGLGPMILLNGLLPTLAFRASKAKARKWSLKSSSAEERVLADVWWMLVDAGLLHEKEDPLDALAAMSSERYARARDEALAAVGWLKRLSLATWERKKGNDAPVRP